MLLTKGLQRYPVILTQIKANIRALSSMHKSKDEKIKAKYDIIVAGGGMVGCTLACALGKNPLLSKMKMLLLEGNAKQDFQLNTEYSNRVVALNQNTKSLMNSLNVWSHVERARLQPIRYMQVWDACSDALISFSSSEVLDDDLAYIVENDLLLNAVNQELSTNTKNVDVVYGAKIAEYALHSRDNTDNNPESLIKMSNGDVYACDLLVSLKVYLYKFTGTTKETFQKSNGKWHEIHPVFSFHTNELQVEAKK